MSKTEVKLIGLDFGTTTSSALIAEAKVGLNCVTGRREFEKPQIIYRSEPVFTPFFGSTIVEEKIERLINLWLKESGLQIEEIFSGGAIITGLAAQRENASYLAKLIRGRFGHSLIATAEDPAFESWLAFMGNSFSLSRFHAQIPLLNLDIGGGTTNPAVGLAGSVQATGCYFVGARHFEFEPGTYRLKNISHYGMALARHLGINKSQGQRLTHGEKEGIVQFYIDALEAMAAGSQTFFTNAVAKLHVQLPFLMNDEAEHTIITFSGGVGDLIYRFAEGETFSETTVYGDLGIDLAQAILASALLSKDVHSYVPEKKGRATVAGIALHSTEISGTTLFLRNPNILPLENIPILARLPLNARASDIEQALFLIQKNPGGACIQFLRSEQTPKAQEIMALGNCLREKLAVHHATEYPLVFLVPGDYGKTIGNYATDWGKLNIAVLVIDQIADRAAHFVHIGRARDQVIPVSFFGMY